MTCYPRMRNAGFTLLEMLVVLVITTLISTLLLFGISHVLQVRIRLLDHVRQSQQGFLPEYWFRSSVQSLVPDYPPNPYPEFFQAAEPRMFYGTAQSFGGLTLAALDDENGVTLPFTWQLSEAEDGLTHLQYINSSGEIWDVAKWQGLGRFEYLDDTRTRHPQWPPTTDAPQLPEAVICHGSQHGKPFLWLSPVIGIKKPKQDNRNIFF